MAIVRQLQWVAAGGVVWVVASTIAFTFAVGIVGLRPRPGLVSASAGEPPSAKRSRHKITVGRETPRSRAIALLDSPPAAASTKVIDYLDEQAGVHGRRGYLWPDTIQLHTANAGQRDSMATALLSCSRRHEVEVEELQPAGTKRRFSIRVRADIKRQVVDPPGD